MTILVTGSSGHLGEALMRSLRPGTEPVRGTVLSSLAEGRDFRSDLAQVIGCKGYHPVEFADGPYPTEKS